MQDHIPKQCDVLTQTVIPPVPVVHLKGVLAMYSEHMVLWKGLFKLEIRPYPICGSTETPNIPVDH